MDALSAAALQQVGTWLARKLLDATAWDAPKNQLKKHAARVQWEKALQAAANAVRRDHPEVAIELFDADFLKVVLKPNAQALQAPLVPADIGAVAEEFRTRYRSLRLSSMLPEARPAVLARADQEVEPAIKLFFGALQDELSTHADLKTIWRDRTIADTAKNVAQLVQLANSANPGASTVHADKALEAASLRLMRRRAFPTHHEDTEVAALAAEVIQGEHQFASAEIRSRILRMCSRVTAIKDSSLAASWLNEAKKLSPSVKTEVEDAWLAFAIGNKDDAIRRLRDRTDNFGQAATFSMIRARDGGAAATGWLDQFVQSLGHWSGPQACIAIFTYLAEGNWSGATRRLATLSPRHLEECPALHIAAAATAAREIAIVGSDSFLLGLAFPLAPHSIITHLTPDWQDICRNAVEGYDTASKSASDLDLPDEASRYEELALWLSFEAPALKSVAEQRVRLALTDAKAALDVVPFALANNIPVPSDKLRELLAQREAVGGLTPTEVRAALLLAESPADVLALFKRRRSDLEEALGKSKAAFVEIESTLYAHGADAASTLFETLREQLDSQDQDRLRAMLAKDADAKATALAAVYAQSKDPSDLRSLCRHFAAKGQWNGAADRHHELFLLTKLTADAETLCAALTNADRLDELSAFFDSFWPVLDQTPTILSFRARALAQGGHLVEARQILEGLLAAGGGPREEQLYSNVLIESGDWDRLSEIVERVWQRRDDRSASHLVWAARAASVLDMPGRAIELLRAATARQDADADAFTSAAATVFEVGKDDEVPELAAWFQRAFEMSGESGPMRSMDIKSMVEQMPEWRKTEAEVLRGILSGEMPLFIAGRGIGTSLGDVILGNALRAQQTTDLRRHSIVPLFFGGRPPHPLPVKGRIGLDLSTILVFQSLGLLDTLLASGLDLTIPAGTLNALFLERQRARFHQPSRIAHCEEILNAVASKKLLPLEAEPASPKLAAEVGPDLAGLVVAAKKGGGLVVRPPPITRPGDFSEREVDRSGFADILTDTRAILAFLDARGLLSNLVHQRARSHLHRVDKGWPNSADPTQAQAFYLDGLALHYLQDAGVLSLLAQTGIPIYVEQGEIDQAAGLVTHRSNLATYYAALEHARTALRDAIASGKLRVSAMRSVANLGDDGIHPTVQILHMEGVDWVVVDDRALNRHAYADSPTVDRIPIGTSLDLLTLLEQGNHISSSIVREARHAMRDSGFFFVPFQLEELEDALRSCRVQATTLQESRQLRLIRETFLRLSTVKDLECKGENAFLDHSYRTVVLALYGAWRSNETPEAATAHANWLLRLLREIELFASLKFAGLRADAIAPMLAPILIPSFDKPQPMQDAQRTWIEEAFWPHVAENPATAAAVIQSLRGILGNYLSDDDNQ